MTDMAIMLDIETTGTDTGSCKLLQIAMLPIEFKDGYFHPYFPKIASLEIDNFNVNKNGFVFTQAYKGPISEWGQKYQFDLYQKCASVQEVRPLSVRAEMLSYIKTIGCPTPFTAAGKNLGVFDMPILQRLQYLTRSDFHYRLEDMSGCFKLAQRVTGKTKEELEKIAREVCPVTHTVPGGAHEALYDCYDQTNVYNGLIKFMRDLNKN